MKTSKTTNFAMLSVHEQFHHWTLLDGHLGAESMNLLCTDMYAPPLVIRCVLRICMAQAVH